MTQLPNQQRPKEDCDRPLTHPDINRVHPMNKTNGMTKIDKEIASEAKNNSSTVDHNVLKNESFAITPPFHLKTFLRLNRLSLRHFSIWLS